MNKRNEMKALIDIHHPDIIGITEVKPKKARYDIQESELDLPGYDMYHTLDGNNRGMVLYVRSEMKPSPCDKLKTDFSEGIFVECEQDNETKLLVGLMYRSPSSSPDNTGRLNKLIQEISDLNNSHTLLMGDFNYPEINWTEERSEGGQTNPATLFLKATRDAYLIQHQREPTRYRKGERENVLDLVFTNREDMVEEINTIAGLGKSDHLTLEINLNWTIPEPARTKRFNFQKTDENKLKEALKRTDWEEELANSTVEEAWEMIKQQISEAIIQSTPISQTSGKKGKDGWTRTP